MKIILIKYGELTTKKDNRKVFINILINTFLLSFLVVNSPYLINIIFIYITHFFILYLNNIDYYH